MLNLGWISTIHFAANEFTDCLSKSVPMFGVTFLRASQVVLTFCGQSSLCDARQNCYHQFFCANWTLRKVRNEFAKLKKEMSLKTPFARTKR